VSPAASAWWASRAGFPLPREQRRQNAPVQLRAPERVDRLLHGAARELMPERDVVALHLEDAGGEALVECARRPVEHTREQLELRVPPDNGGGIGDLAGGAAELCGASEDRVADALGNARAARRQHLGDEERITAGQPVELGGVDLRALGECLHAALGERRKRDPPLAWDVPQEHPQRMARAELVVAVGGDEQRRRLL
jgi:hypothetical protein